MILGYAYPAYECYKSVELNKPEIEQLRFWCQYWSVYHLFHLLGILIGGKKHFLIHGYCFRILVAAMSFFERIGDVLIAW